MVDGPSSQLPRKAGVGTPEAWAVLTAPACLVRPPQPPGCPDCPYSWASTLTALEQTMGSPGPGTAWPVSPPSLAHPSRHPHIPVMGCDTHLPPALPQQTSSQLASQNLAMAPHVPFVLLNFIPFPSCWAQGRPGSSSSAKGSYLKRGSCPEAGGFTGSACGMWWGGF